MEIRKYTKAEMEDVMRFETELREEEEWGWDIDEAYRKRVEKSFADERFRNSVSFLAYFDGKVVGRVDAALICSHFDGTIKAYLDWICVLKRARHRGAAQALMGELRRYLREEYGVDTLVGLMAQNEEAQRFYRSMEGAGIHDEGIWIDC